MRLFLNKEQVQDVPSIIWRDKQRILSYLWGINYSNDHAEGIYRTILTVWRSPGQLFIEIPGYLIILMSRYPFAHVEKSEGLEISP